MTTRRRRRRITTAATPFLRDLRLPSPDDWRAFFATPVPIRAAMLCGFYGS